MNIFVLDRDPVIAASYQCNKHVVKMILESVQLLSGALRMIGVEDDRLYKITHKNHPCAVWVRESTGNFDWLVEHCEGLCQEYFERYGRVHASSSVLEVCRSYTGMMHSGALTVPVCCDGSDNIVCSSWDECVYRYRELYMTAKADICVWPEGKVPWWWEYR